MNEKPIIFSTEMVTAILDGHKTQTRRILKPQPKYSLFNDPKWQLWDSIWVDGYGWQRKCPYGLASDLLYVRETFKQMAWTDKECSMAGYSNAPTNPTEKYLDIPLRAIHKARYKPTYAYVEKYEKWKPSIHMPKWAARIWLKIENVRVEQVQDITPDDCYSEGCTLDNQPGIAYSYQEIKNEFQELWDSINLKRGYDWNSNPWIWVIDFAVVSTTGKPNAIRNT